MSDETFEGSAGASGHPVGESAGQIDQRPTGYTDSSGRPASPELLNRVRTEATARRDALKRAIVEHQVSRGAAPAHLREELRGLNDFLLHGGEPPPGWRMPPTAEDLAAPAKDAHGFTSEHATALAREYQPAASAASYKPPATGPGAAVAAADGELVHAGRNLAAALQMPGPEGSVLVGSFLESVDLESGDLARVRSEERRAELEGRAIKHFGSREAWESADAAASKYLESVLTPEQLQSFGEILSGSELLYDPRVVSRLAHLARMRGIAT